MADINALASQIQSLDQGYNPTQVYNDITTKLGIPDARTRVQALSQNLVDTENAIRAVDPNVTARTSSALVTEAQRGRLVNMEKAPLTDTYNQQNQSYGKEQGNLSELNSQANTQAGLAESDYKNKRQSLADQLTTALQQQAAAEAKAESDRQFAESQRQFNVSSAQNATKIAQSGAAANPAVPGSQQRADKGFNFQDANGKSISARLYAQLTGTNFNTLLKKMASMGDKGAADVLKNGGSASAYKSLTWD